MLSWSLNSLRFVRTRRQCYRHAFFSRCRCHQNGCKTHSKWYHWQQKKYVGECSHVTKFFSQKFRLKLLPPANEVSGRQCFYTCISFRSPPHPPDHTRHYYRNEVGARLYFHRRVWFCSQGVSASVHIGIPPSDQAPPPGAGTPPWTRHTHPHPLDQAPLRTRHTPHCRACWEIWSNTQAVCILLECNLVLYWRIEFRCKWDRHTSAQINGPKLIIY